MKLTNKDLFISYNQNGSLSITAFLDNSNHIFTHYYYCYTLTEAKKLFKKTVKEMNI